MLSSMLSSNLSNTLRRALSSARKTFHHKFATIEHLLYALTFDKDVQETLVACGVDFINIRKSAEKLLKNKAKTDGAIIPDNDVKPDVLFQKLVRKAAVQTHVSGQCEVNGIHVLIEMFSEQNSECIEALHEHGARCIDIINHINAAEHHSINNIFGKQNELMDLVNGNQMQNFLLFQPHEQKEKDGNKWISKYCTDLTVKARNKTLDPVYGCNDVVRQMSYILLRKNKNNVLCIGHSGVGKTSAVYGLAHSIVNRDQVTEKLHNMRILELDLCGIVSGTRYRGDFEERIKSLFSEIEASKDVILFIDNMHSATSIGAPSGSNSDGTNMLRQYIDKSSVLCVGAINYDEYYEHISKDGAFMRRFEALHINEPSKEQTFLILRNIKSTYEKFHDVRYSDSILHSIVDLSDRYNTARFFPDKAIDVLDIAGSRYRANPTKYKKKISIDDVRQVVSSITNVDCTSMTRSDMARLKTLRSELHSKILDQKDAVDDVVDAIYVSKSGLNDADRPIANFLFVGPTGVGKTELAKQLASLMNMALLRFDMSEYSESHTTSSLIGAPPGYVGFEKQGALVAKVRQHPHSILLLDEIEKAHSNIHNLLLQIMDYGFVTDGKGMKVDFRNCIIIMTSNVGSHLLDRNPMGFDNDSAFQSSDFEKSLSKAFSPEFIGRLSSVVKFNALKGDTILDVADKFIAELQLSLDHIGVDMLYEKDIAQYVMQCGYDAKYGARKMRGVIYDKFKKKIAESILFGNIKKGSKIKVISGQEGLEFSCM